MQIFNTAFVTFFPVTPDNMGSSTVVNSRFNNWPDKKKLFQMSHNKNINNKYLKTIFIRKESPINKILALPRLIKEIYKYLGKSKNVVNNYVNFLDS